MKTRTIVFSVLGVIVLMVFCFAFTIHILLLNVRNEYRKLNLGDKREEKRIEYLNLVQKMIEDDFNVIINKDLYEVEYVFIPNGNIITADSFIMKKRKLTYKSKYFYPIFEKSEKVMIVDHMDDGYLLNKEKESYYKDERLSLFLAIISRFGFEEYVLNNLLYNESKGNNFSEIEKISENRFRAKDWDIELETSDMILENHKVLGVRAHFIEFIKSEENSFEVEIDKVIEDVFTYIILVRKKGARKSIRVEVTKDIWKKVEHEKNLFITLRKEDLILLEAENN